MPPPHQKMPGIKKSLYSVSFISKFYDKCQKSTEINVYFKFLYPFLCDNHLADSAKAACFCFLFVWCLTTHQSLWLIALLIVFLLQSSYTQVSIKFKGFSFNHLP